MKEERHIYMFTSAGWQHLGTGKVVNTGGISLDAADIQALKELQLQAEDEKEASSDQPPVTKKEKRSSS